MTLHHKRNNKCHPFDIHNKKFKILYETQDYIGINFIQLMKNDHLTNKYNQHPFLEYIVCLEHRQKIVYDVLENLH